MDSFAYSRPDRTEDAVALGTAPGSRYVAGGTDLLNLMKDGVQRHDRLVDINSLPLTDVRVSDTLVRLGSLSRMSDVAAHGEVVRRLPALAQALLASASPQVRNMASLGGNLLQRTRCWYFRDPAMPCNKRDPGSGCAALDGVNRWHAVLGGSDHCIAVHPSDLAVALTALEATVRVVGADGPREIPVAEFYPPPGDTPHVESTLRPGELITGVDVPVTELARSSRYLKVRDRATFEFAVVSVAAAVLLSGDVVREARLVFGGVAPRPWRSREAERELVGRRLDDPAISAAVTALVRDAVPREHNAFKVPLLQRATTDVLRRFRRTR
ncbi:xanthine dehydrogenase family protein subunit M [Umezawaea sp.]|uniref:FAD binding domain-containing protein n=1 Tax=Umezawaea sp. TaxID=1955258 RepID=UPI002ED29E21